jgi:DNA-binding beta-propeller fold protein YncE
MSTLVTVGLLIWIVAALAGSAYCIMVLHTRGSSGTWKVLASTGILMSIVVLIVLIATLLRSVTPSSTMITFPHPGSSSATNGSPSNTTSGTQHYEYVFPDGSVAVYDIDHGHKLVKQLSLPTRDGVRGVVGNAAMHRLYISHGSDGNSGGSLLAYDLLTDTVLWNKTYAHGIDSMAITPDGKTIYMPDGETANAPYWYVINAADGSEQGTKINGGPGPHNTVVSLNGTHVYMGARNFSDGPTLITVADTTTNRLIRTIGPFVSGVRPFTINSRETLAYVTTTGLLGFQVASIQSGRVLYTVDLTRLGFPNSPIGPTAPSHGIALSPDEKTVAVIDWPNDMVHLFDVTGLPNAAPHKTADIKFSRSMHHNEAGCAYDCAADGWLEYSRDGRFLYVGDVGDVIDTATNTIVTNISTLYNTRKMLEVDFQHAAVSYVPNNRTSVGYGAPQPGLAAADILDQDQRSITALVSCISKPSSSRMSYGSR